MKKAMSGFKPSQKQLVSFLLPSHASVLPFVASFLTLPCSLRKIADIPEVAPVPMAVDPIVVATPLSSSTRPLPSSSLPLLFDDRPGFKRPNRPSNEEPLPSLLAWSLPRLLPPSSSLPPSSLPSPLPSSPLLLSSLLPSLPLLSSPLPLLPPPPLLKPPPPFPLVPLVEHLEFTLNNPLNGHPPLSLSQERSVDDEEEEARPSTPNLRPPRSTTTRS